MNGRRIVADFRLYARAYVRSPEAIFFSLFFPVLLILMFGAIYSGSTVSSVPIYVQNNDHNSTESYAFIKDLERTGVLQVHMIDLGNLNLTVYLQANSYSNGLLIPAGFNSTIAAGHQANITVVTNPSDPSTTALVEGAVTGVLNEINERGQPPIVGMIYEGVGGTSYSTVDYVVPSLIGLSILMNPMFSMVTLTSEYKKEKLFKQLSLTPLTRADWLLAKILWFWMITAVSAVILLSIGYLVFHVNLTLTVWLLPFLILGPLFFVALGMLIGTLSKKAETAGFIGNLVTFPMMFLSGAFIPVELQPTWLQPYAKIWPLYYVIDGINDVTIFNNPARAFGDLLVVAVMAAVTFVAAVYFFKWRED